jgi:hypothetical protein
MEQFQNLLIMMKLTFWRTKISSSCTVCYDNKLEDPFLDINHNRQAKEIEFVVHTVFTYVRELEEQVPIRRVISGGFFVTHDENGCDTGRIETVVVFSVVQLDSILLLKYVLEQTIK